MIPSPLQRDHERLKALLTETQQLATFLCEETKKKTYHQVITTSIEHIEMLEEME